MSTKAAKRQPTPPPPGTEYFKVEEVAFMLRVSIASVYREIAAGKLARRPFRGRLFIHRDDLAAHERSRYTRERTTEEKSAETPATPRRIDLVKSGLWDGADD